jgi:hypothetical protein
LAWASAIKGGYYQQDQETFLANAEIVDIDEKKFDLFQEVFSEDYIKIALVIKEKKKKTGMNHEDLMAKKLEKLGQGLKV